MGSGSKGVGLQLYRVRRVRKQQSTTRGDGCSSPAEGGGANSRALPAEGEGLTAEHCGEGGASS